MRKVVNKFYVLGMSVLIGIPLFASCRTQKKEHTSYAVETSEVGLSEKVNHSAELSTTISKDSVTTNGWKVEFYPPTDSTNNQAVKSISAFGSVATSMTTAATATAATDTTTTASHTHAATTTTTEKESKPKSKLYWLLLIPIIYLIIRYVRKLKK